MSVQTVPDRAPADDDRRRARGTGTRARPAGRTESRGTARATARGRAQASSRAAARASRDADRGAGARRGPEAPGGTVPFVLLIMTLLGAGLVTTLGLSTSAAADSYQLEDAHNAANTRSEQVEGLRRDVESLQSAPAIAGGAQRLGLVPAGSPAILIVGPDGTSQVVGAATPVAPPPAAPAPAPGPAPAGPAPAGAAPGPALPATATAPATAPAPAATPVPAPRATSGGHADPEAATNSGEGH